MLTVSDSVGSLERDADASLPPTSMMYPPTLSDKAKGKQRAVDPLLAASSSPTTHASASQPGPAPPLEEPTSRELVVRFTEGAPDLTLRLDKRDTVRDVKKHIRSARPELQTRRLRLIHAGRLLTDGTFLFAWLASLEERQQRAKAHEAGPPPPPPSAGAPPLSPSSPGLSSASPGFTPASATFPPSSPSPGSETSGMIWIHCSVGPVMDPGEMEDDTAEQTGQLQPARGFDRLASLGFSPEDIENFRAQFHSQSYANYLDVDVDDEDYDEHARALEEQWIDNLDNTGSLAQTSPSATSTLQGVLLGFFFPLMPFFFMRVHRPAIFWEDNSIQPPVSHPVFPRPMSGGIIVGLLVNILFGIWRFLLDSS